MRDAIAQYLPWAISAVTLAAIVLQGNRRASGWALGLASQALWIAWIWAEGAWGILPLTIALVFLNARNWMKWGTAEVVGYVIADSAGTRYRCWGDEGPGWTDHVESALLFANRESAEAMAAEDEDAWKIIRVSWVEQRKAGVLPAIPWPRQGAPRFPPPPPGWTAGSARGKRSG